MASTPQDTLISWLKDAHALETNVIQTLERHIDDAKSHPHIQSRMRAHLEESRRHADLVESCLKRYGTGTSGIKETIGKIGGVVQGVAANAAPDTLVKNALGDYAAEHFEIACYRSLKAAATVVGDNETVRICEQILADEERMADWLQQQIPLVTSEFLGVKANEVNR